MEAEYEAFCAKDPHFYDKIDDGAEERLFAPLSESATPVGWQRITVWGWVNYQPRGAHTPMQGWKIHVSSSVGRAEEVVQLVFDYCVRRAVPFKLVPSPWEYHRRNRKYAERAGSGKLATIYPLNEAQLESLVTELGELLHDVQGPYILSDLRWMDTPVYVRYGAFSMRRVKSANGREVMAIEDADGNLVPDHRGPVFSIPEWVTLPDFLRPALERRNASRIDDLPYEITAALHYSNGGGVYEAREKSTGTKVIVKEARPHAGLDVSGNDAVFRLRRERDALSRLSGLPRVPQLKGYYEAVGHEFLVEEFIEGESLYAACGRRNPLLTDGTVDERELAEYRDWAMGMWQGVADAVRAMHERGVVFGDLHPHNVLCPPQGEDDARICLIDFEGGWFLEEGGRQVVANPGFIAPRGTTGVAVDEHALAALKFAVFAPLTAMFQLSNALPGQVADIIVDRFGVPRSWFADAVGVLQEASAPSARPAAVSSSPEAWSALASSVADGIRASATLEHADRLFPGDIAQFFVAGAELGMAHGAAGVLWALQTAGVGSVPEGERWLLDRVFRDGPDLPDIPPGFYNGWHGVAYALWELGLHDAAVDLLARSPVAEPRDTDLSLADGLAGSGLSWLHFARECGDDRYLQRALDTADLVRSRLGDIEDVPEVSGGAYPQAGLMQGRSGPALFLTTVFEETGDTTYLDAAERALRQDLRRCRRDGMGIVQVNEGFRLMPYLASGSTGIGIALDRYLMNRPLPELEKELAAIQRAARKPFYLYPGLFNGRAGMILATASHQPANLKHTAMQVTGLDWHTLDWHGHLAFPGTQLLRISMDLATGGAGILLALAAAHTSATEPERRLSLPFLLHPKTSGHPLGG
ncbi:class III lanthionine synthetase LanKC [Streptomyces sp. NPDC047315]|uniref:class III lanthionine synthetase LanKC n=1 Tax=Streptomyces sp. NPDC047315 TaxID=3155142 RepID=UPI0033D27660